MSLSQYGCQMAANLKQASLLVCREDYKAKRWINIQVGKGIFLS
jgi:hypothetical protein